MNTESRTPESTSRLTPAVRRVDRIWFLTWRTYGTWLPGDERGFVDPIVDGEGNRIVHNEPGTPLDADNPALRNFAANAMRGEAVYLNKEQAIVVLEQLRETAAHRNWTLMAVAIMANHVHVVVGVPGDPDPADLLRDFKSYASRKLNQHWPRPASGTWWAESGSRRILKDEKGRRGSIHYVLDCQQNPLLTWDGERPA